MGSTMAGSTADSKVGVQLPITIDKLHLDQDGMDHDISSDSESSQSTCVPPTPAPTPRLLSRVLYSNDYNDTQVPIVNVCSTGDILLNVRRRVSDIGAENLCLGPLMRARPLGRFRVSSAVLKMASPYMKNCLDAPVGDTTILSGQTQGTGLAAAGSPRLQKDHRSNLDLIIEQPSDELDEAATAVRIFLKIIHFKMNPKECIRTRTCGVGVVTTLVAEIAYTLGCVGPVVPWINLWLTRDLSKLDTTWLWVDCYNDEYYQGIIAGYVLKDKVAFKRWSGLCIRYDYDYCSCVGLGYVWNIVCGKLNVPNSFSFFPFFGGNSLRNTHS